MAWILPLAERLGAPGLAIIAFLDSSFLSLPQVGDALIVALTIQHPERWMLYSAATTLAPRPDASSSTRLPGKAAKRFSGGGSARRKSSGASACSGATGCWP